MSAEQVRKYEASAAAELGRAMFSLMESAGSAAFAWLGQRYPAARQVLVLAGVGNNAGDGYIVARLAQQSGLQVTLACAEPERGLSGGALQAQQQWLAAGNTLQGWQALDFSHYDLIVDALLGTGLNGNIRAPMHQLIGLLNRCSTPVLSLDLPSGLNADSGQPHGLAVEADSTITFVAIKPGLVTGIGKHYCGQLVLDELGIGLPFHQRADTTANLISWSELRPLVARQQHANKGKFGRLLCIGGNRGMAGAIRLTAEAALRCGAGLVKVFCHPDSQVRVAAGRPEIMLNQGCGLAELRAALDWSSCVVLGPGLGRDNWGKAMFAALMACLRQQPKPLVIDADGLYFLANSDSQSWQSVLQHAVLTPHPGEAARLLGCSIEQIEADRYAATRALVTEYPSAMVLKGAGSVIAWPAALDSEQPAMAVCSDGNPGMATAGMGDVLSGVIAAMLGQSLHAAEAARYGVCLHAAAGDRLANAHGQRGMIAGDLFEPLRALINYQ